MSNPKIRYQNFIYIITALGQVVDINEETDKLYNTCTGINVVLSDDNAKFSTLTVDINSIEFFPENWEVIRLRFREQIPFGEDDYHRLNVAAAGARIKGKYTDKTGAVYPYTVSISIRLENL